MWPFVVVSMVFFGVACSSPALGSADARPQSPLVDGMVFVDATAIDAPPNPDADLPVVHDPVIFVHGINGNESNFDTMRSRLVADGWQADRLYAYTFADPAWGCNVDSAATIQGWVTDILAETGATRVDVVAHSMGTLSSRYFVKNLGGQDVVNTYVTLGGMHHGLLSPCFNPLPVCVWNELCQWKAFITALNADPATPGNLAWVSIYGTADATVPNDSSNLVGAENISLEGIEHDGPAGLLEQPVAYDEVARVLQYPAW